MKYKIHKLFNRGYEATVKRGCITSQTKPIDFFNKFDEEIQEVRDSANNRSEHLMEVADVIEVGVNYLIYLGEDPIKILEKVIEKNEQRAKEATNKLEK